MDNFLTCERTKPTATTSTWNTISQEASCNWSCASSSSSSVTWTLWRSQNTQQLKWPATAFSFCHWIFFQALRLRCSPHFGQRRVEIAGIIDMSESIQSQMELFWSVSLHTDDLSKMMTETESILKIHDCLYQPAWKIISATAFVTAVLTVTVVLQLSNQVRNTGWSIPLHDSPGNCWSADWFIQGLLITWSSPQVLTITRPSITCHLAKSVRMQNWMCTQ